MTTISCKIVFILVACLLIACGGRLPPEAASDAGATDAVAATTDAPVDASAPDGGDAAPAADPFAHCPPGGNVFYTDVEGPLGTISLGERTYTDSNATWLLMTSPPFELMVRSRTDGSDATLTVSTSGAQIVPGTYPQGPSGVSEGPWIEVTRSAEGCALESGSLTIVDVQLPDPDGGGGRRTITLSFDVLCHNTEPLDRFRGCLRYSE